jgi:hypothetical protein
MIASTSSVPGRRVRAGAATAQQQEQQGHGDQTAPQVVEDLPPGQSGKRIGHAPGVGTGNPRQQPLRDLPIAANPAVPPVNVHVVAGGIFLVELHVAHEGRAGMARFQQIVAEDGVLREAPVHGPLEGIHIVDAFADERAFLENILIHVGHFPRVGIDARVAGKQPDEPGSPGARQAHAHARLQDAVAFGDDPAHRIELRTVQADGPSCRRAVGRHRAAAGCRCRA